MRPDVHYITHVYMTCFYIISFYMEVDKSKRANSWANIVQGTTNSISSVTQLYGTVIANKTDEVYHHINKNTVPNPLRQSCIKPTVEHLSVQHVQHQIYIYVIAACFLLLKHISPVDSPMYSIANLEVLFHINFFLFCILIWGPRTNSAWLS
jgi:hypothetical protein